MLKNVFVALWALTLLLGASAQAANVVVDFEDTPLSSGSAVLSQGFKFDASNQIVNFIGVGGSKGLGLGFPAPDSTVMTEISGASFDLLSVDFLLFPVAENELPITILANKADGTELQQSVLTVPSFATITLPPDWTDLVQVAFVTDGPVVADNLVVANVVPVPAAIWLFGSAIAGLGWFRRKSVN